MVAILNPDPFLLTLHNYHSLQVCIGNQILLPTLLKLIPNGCDNHVLLVQSDEMYGF